MNFLKWRKPIVAPVVPPKPPDTGSLSNISTTISPGTMLTINTGQQTLWNGWGGGTATSLTNATHRVWGVSSNGLFKLKRKPSAVEGFPEIRACHPYGSRYTCDPAPIDTDDDTIVWVKEFPNPDKMKELGWEIDGKDVYGDTYFQSYRREFKNLVMVEDKTVYLRCVAAALLCKQLNLLKKEERVTVHQWILNGYHHSLTGDCPIPNRGLL